MSSNIPMSWIVERLNSPLGKEQRVFKPARHVIPGPTLQWEPLPDCYLWQQRRGRRIGTNRLVLDPRHLPASKETLDKSDNVSIFELEYRSELTC